MKFVVRSIFTKLRFNYFVHVVSPICLLYTKGGGKGEALNSSDVLFK